MHKSFGRLWAEEGTDSGNIFELEAIGGVKSLDVRFEGQGRVESYPEAADFRVPVTRTSPVLVICTIIRVDGRFWGKDTKHIEFRPRSIFMTYFHSIYISAMMILDAGMSEMSLQYQILLVEIFYIRPFLMDPLRMDKDRDKMAERILHLTLEILYRLSGEDYTVVKKTSRESCHTAESEGWGRHLRPIMGPPPHPLIHEDMNDQKILELVYKMIELLTGEVPIRCHDVTIYFSMEEWEYLEGHKDLYKDVMKEVPQPLTSPVVSSNKTTPERCPRPLLPQDCKQENPNVPLDHQVPTISGPLSGDLLYDRIFLIDSSRMDRSSDKIAERILHLTLEILFRLTGELLTGEVTQLGMLGHYTVTL
ncbi:uncharacterized protein [Ranitomeya imitator]|uniref:uncharacterized protein n=1 Tax=Ranitomeya imitator TaxID=111125 RepID=UPI0037E980EF